MPLIITPTIIDLNTREIMFFIFNPPKLQFTQFTQFAVYFLYPVFGKIFGKLTVFPNFNKIIFIFQKK